MLITTIPGSLDVLKVRIAANVKNIQPNKGSEKNGALLELTSGVQIYSANAACSYFFENGSSENIDSWLEWENVVLRPICYHVYISSLNKSTIDTPLWEQFLKLLRHLDNALTGKQFLIGSELSCADIVIWSTLYTAVTQVNLLKDCPAVTVWFESLAQTSAFANAVKDTDLNKNNIKKFLTSGILPALPTNNATVDKGQKPTAPITNEVKEAVAVTPAELKAAKSAWEQPKIRKIKENASPILPIKGEENVMITSALPYVNNVPHLGNIIGCVLSADIYARYRRLCQDNVLYICGTDEYGTTTETKALEEGITPKEICDKYNALHTEVYDWFGISFDYFGRTSTPMQTEVAHDIFWKLEKNGYICKDTLDQLQCVACNRFLADRFVNGTCPFCAYDDARGDQCDACGKLINAVELKDPKCSTCKASPRIKTTKHLFIDLPKLEGKLETYLEKQFEEGLWTSNARVITKSWIRDGLKPRCITRDLKWGVPVPLEGYTDKVFYVWYDAPIGYISITANYTDQWKKWWKAPDQVDYYNFMAKDNIPFHSVIFPSCLLGADDDWTIVNHMSATEYLNYEDGKFSKSRGVGVFGNQVRDTGIPADIWRFYLLYVRPESQDSCFSWDDFVTKNNSELLNNLGNFINRGLMFTANFFKGVIPAMALNGEDFELIAQINREISNYNENLQKIRLREGLRCVLMISKLGNQYIQANKPWVLVKGNETEKLRAGTVIGLADNVSCLLSVLLEPYMPETSAIIQAQLNTPKTVNVTTDTLVCWLKEGHQIGTPKPLFQKIEPSLAAELKKKYQGKQQPVTSKASGSEPATRLTAEALQKLNNDITAQGNKVRDLKAAKAEKSKITAEVKTLLALKAQLTAASSESTGAPNTAGGSQSKDATTAPLSGGKCDQGEIDRLTEEVKVQGDKVREMKSSGAEKSEINSAVQKLLELKNSLAKAQGIDPSAAAAPSQKSKGKKKRGGKKK